MNLETRLGRSTSVNIWTAHLRDQGYCVIDDAIDAQAVAALNYDLDARFAQTPFCDGGFYGRRTKRFGSLLKRSALVAQFVQHPLGQPIGVTKLYELIKAGEVQTVKLGKVTLIPLSSLEAVVARHRTDHVQRL